MEEVTTRIYVFFVATAISVMALHIGICRLIASVDQKERTHITREQPGLVIVIEFALVVTLCSALPFLFKELVSPDHFYAFSALTTAAFTIVAAFVERRRSKSSPNWIYYCTLWGTIGASIVVVLWSGVYIWGEKFVDPNTATPFVVALVVPLIVMVIQFIKTTRRFADRPLGPPATGSQASPGGLRSEDRKLFSDVATSFPPDKAQIEETILFKFALKDGNTVRLAMSSATTKTLANSLVQLTAE